MNKIAHNFAINERPRHSIYGQSALSPKPSLPNAGITLPSISSKPYMTPKRSKAALFEQSLLRAEEKKYLSRSPHLRQTFNDKGELVIPIDVQNIPTLRVKFNHQQRVL